MCIDFLLILLFFLTSCKLFRFYLGAGLSLHGIFAYVHTFVCTSSHGDKTSYDTPQTRTVLIHSDRLIRTVASIGSSLLNTAKLTCNDRKGTDYMVTY